MTGNDPIYSTGVAFDRRAFRDDNAKRKSQRTADERNFGYSAAHEAIPVPLLPSGPGGVRGTSSHRARSSTHRQSRRQAATANEV
jgi:hypothetical protein